MTQNMTDALVMVGVTLFLAGMSAGYILRSWFARKDEGMIRCLCEMIAELMKSRPENEADWWKDGQVVRDEIEGKEW